MINVDKVKLMTGIAMYEKKEGKKIFPVTRFFKGDYVGSHLLYAFFAHMFCFALCAAVWVMYNSEQLLAVMSIDELAAMAKAGCAVYVVSLTAYLVVTGIVYSKRYSCARRGMKVYLAKLKRLERQYEHEDRTKELTKEGIRHDGASRT